MLSGRLRCCPGTAGIIWVITCPALLHASDGIMCVLQLQNGLSFRCVVKCIVVVLSVCSIALCCTAYCCGISSCHRHCMSADR